MSFRFATSFAIILSIPTASNSQDLRDVLRGAASAVISDALRSGSQSSGRSGTPSAPSPRTQTQSISILEVQVALNALGYEAGPEDGLPGRKTTNAIQSFQRDMTYPVTGKLSNFEQNALFSAKADAEGWGTIGDAQFRLAQHLLTLLNYNIGGIDGKWGNKSQSALEDFRRSNGSDASGSVSQTDIFAMHNAAFPAAALLSVAYSNESTGDTPVIAKPSIAPIEPAPQPEQITVTQVAPEPQSQVRPLPTVQDRVAMRQQQARQLAASRAAREASPSRDIFKLDRATQFFNFRTDDELSSYGGRQMRIATDISDLSGQFFLIKPFRDLSDLRSWELPKALPDTEAEFAVRVSNAGEVYLFNGDEHKLRLRTVRSSRDTVECFQMPTEERFSNSDTPNGYCLTLGKLNYSYGTSPRGVTDETRSHDFLITHHLRSQNDLGALGIVSDRASIGWTGTIGHTKKISASEYEVFKADAQKDELVSDLANAAYRASGKPWSDLSVYEMPQTVRAYLEPVYNGSPDERPTLNFALDADYSKKFFEFLDKSMFLQYHTSLGTNCDLSAVSTKPTFNTRTNYEGTTTSYRPWLKGSVIRTRTSNYSQETVEGIAVQTYAHATYERLEKEALADLLELVRLRIAASERNSGSSSALLEMPVFQMAGFSILYPAILQDIEPYMIAMQNVFEQDSCAGPTFHKLGYGFDSVVGVSK